MQEILKKVRKLEIKIRRLVEATFAGEYHSAFKGQGLEFDEVRLYQFGDDIRSIDWNVTAKTGEVHIKKFREEREQTLFVLFDTSASEDFGAKDSNKLMVGTEIAAILAFSAMKNNDKIGLATFTDRIEKFFAAKKGRKHILGIIRGLLTYKPKYKGTKISEALDFAKKVLRRKSIIIVISDFLDDGYEKALRHLAQKHDVIAIRLHNPGEVLDRGGGFIPVLDSESGKLRWVNLSGWGSRKKINQKFREIEERLTAVCEKNGIDMLSINTEHDYLPHLERFFRKRVGRKQKRRRTRG